MKDLLEKIAEIGRTQKSSPCLGEVEIFQPYYNGKGELCDLDRQDGNCTRRELITRFLLLNAVLDQGPDMGGVRQLLADTINSLYRKEIRLLHTPLSFFKELGIAVNEIDTIHDIVKKTRERQWKENNNTRKAYNLFMDGASQTLSYAVFRWGVPLAVPLALSSLDKSNTTPLLDFLEEDTKDFPSSAENMSQKIKDHSKYGMGKAIGDKAAHLFAKWLVYTYRLTRKTDSAWQQYSYEVPFDSNAGRVLWRTGFFLHYATEQDLIKKEVIKAGIGKGGKDYLRITNSRGLKATQNLQEIDNSKYKELCTECLKVAKRAPKRIEFQRIPAAILYQNNKYSVGELDDGLMYIGTTYCFNHESPKCPQCPLKNMCIGHTQNDKLIRGYRT